MQKGAGVPVDHPYRRTCRQFVDGHYTEGGRGQYMIHPKYAQAPEHYVRAFLILLKDLRELFDYVEPADANLACYSYRIHALLLRACVDVEANCRAILAENGYSRPGDWNGGLPEDRKDPLPVGLRGLGSELDWGPVSSRAVHGVGVRWIPPLASGVQRHQARPPHAVR